jgi:hypothetical protein
VDFDSEKLKNVVSTGTLSNIKRQHFAYKSKMLSFYIRLYVFVVRRLYFQPQKGWKFGMLMWLPLSLWRTAKEVCTSNNSAKTAYGKSLSLE